MSPRDVALARKRALLMRRSAVLRQQLGRQLDDGLAPVWRSADLASRGWQWLRRNPWVWAVGAVALAVARPTRVAATASRGWGAWMLIRRVMPVVMPVVMPLLTTWLQAGSGAAPKRKD